MTIDSPLSIFDPVNLFSINRINECFLIFLVITSLTIPTFLSETSENPASLGLVDSDCRALVIA
jgi:hypothetical protein